MKQRIAIFASGSGTNAVNFINYFEHHPTIEVACIYCNNPEAGIIQKAFLLDVPVLVFSKYHLKNGYVTNQLKKDAIDFVVLAGFLWLIPADLVNAFPAKIINIHPALLPKYGGKGMYGHHVHDAVIEAKEKVSGITIHLVDERYDHGKYLFQAETKLVAGETPSSLAAKIHQLEQTHFPKVVEDYILNVK